MTIWPKNLFQAKILTQKFITSYKIDPKNYFSAKKVPSKNGTSRIPIYGSYPPELLLRITSKRNRWIRIDFYPFSQFTRINPHRVNEASELFQGKALDHMNERIKEKEAIQNQIMTCKKDVQNNPTTKCTSKQKSLMETFSKNQSWSLLTWSKKLTVGVVNLSSVLNLSLLLSLSAELTRIIKRLLKIKRQWVKTE